MKTALYRTLRGTALFAVPLALIVVLGDALASPADLRVIINFVVALVLVLAIQTFSGNSGIVSFGHVAFTVPSVSDARREVMERGGLQVGEIVTLALSTGANVTWCYVRDPEGNLVELQSWS